MVSYLMNLVISGKDCDTCTYCSGIHGVSKELEASTLTTENTSGHWTRVDSHTQSKILCIRTKFHNHVLDHFTEFQQNVLGETSHCNCMIL